MPKTPMNQNNCSVGLEYQIGFSGENFDMKSIPKTFRMESFSDYQFRLGIFSPDA